MAKLTLTGFAAAAALALMPAVALAQHVDVGPGGVRVQGDDHHHHERRTIEEHHHHGDTDRTGTVRVERHHDHHDDDHED